MAICRACLRACSYVRSGNGPGPPVWWQGAQLANRMGATSLEKVMGAAAGLPLHANDVSAAIAAAAAVIARDVIGADPR